MSTLPQTGQHGCPTNPAAAARAARSTLTPARRLGPNFQSRAVGPVAKPPILRSHLMRTAPPITATRTVRAMRLTPMSRLGREPARPSIGFAMSMLAPATASSTLSFLRRLGAARDVPLAASSARTCPAASKAQLLPAIGTSSSPQRMTKAKLGSRSMPRLTIRSSAEPESVCRGSIVGQGPPPQS